MSEQRAVNRETFSMMIARGAVESHSHVLEATFWTETEAHASTVAVHLAEQHGYSVEKRPVPSHGDGVEPEFRSVVARTGPIPFQIGVIDEWTDVMVRIGWSHGDAEFDGWRVVLP